MRVKHRRPSSFNTKQIINVLFLLTILIGFAAIYNLHGRVKLLPIHMNDNQEPSLASSAVANKSPPVCSLVTLDRIKKQLDPENCRKSSLRPWVQFCSFTEATKCPDATWIDDYYKNTFHSNVASNDAHPFLAISVGCNKGFDAINTMRMGTLNQHFNKDEWVKEMGVTDNNVCLQNETLQFNIQGVSTLSSSLTVRQGEMHCIELMPKTSQKLKQTATVLQVADKGFVVSGVGIGKMDGTHTLRDVAKVGLENQGMATASGCDKSTDVGCIEVPVYSLNNYVDKFVKSKGPIHFLSIDAEGFDFEIIQGGQEILSRVEYLEFEYNWVGPWKTKSLSEGIEYLNHNYDFTCYFAGNGMLWRITDCFLDYYELHFWSNICCVNRHHVVELAKSMELLFEQTVARDDIQYMG